MGSVDSGWNCFRKIRKKRLSSDVSAYEPFQIDHDPHPIINVTEDFSDIDGHSEELVQLPEPENVIVSESEVPRTTEEKLKYFETNFQELISGLSTYEARTGDFKTRVTKIQIEMDELYKEKDKLESDIKELIDLIIKQRENATRVLGNRIVLREADVKETRSRTLAIQKELGEKIESLGLLKRKIDAAANTDFRLREEIKADLRKTNGIVSRYMEEIELLNRNKIVQLKSLRQDTCNMCMPNVGHNSLEEKAKLSAAVECLEHTVYKHTLQRMVAEYRSASRDMNAEVEYLIEQKHTMFEKIESIESALSRLSVNSPSKETAPSTEIETETVDQKKSAREKLYELPKLSSIDSTISPLSSPLSDSKIHEAVESPTSPLGYGENASVPNIPSIFLSRSSVTSGNKIVMDDTKPKLGFSLMRTFSRRSSRKDKNKSPRHQGKKLKKEKSKDGKTLISNKQIVEEKTDAPLLNTHQATIFEAKVECLTKPNEGLHKVELITHTSEIPKLEIAIKPSVSKNRSDLLSIPLEKREKKHPELTRRGSQLTLKEDFVPMLMYCDPVIESTHASPSDIEALPSRPISQTGSLCSVLCTEGVENARLQVQPSGGVFTKADSGEDGHAL